MRVPSYWKLFLAALVISAGCSKNVSETNIPPGKLLSYPDSIYYVQTQPYQVSPAHQQQGIYRAFPNNLLIDSLTGKITVAVMGHGDESQTGLRYKITFTPEGATKPADSTYFMIAGINYLDQIYDLDQHDTIIRPLYNGKFVPVPGGAYGINPDSRLDINPVTGEININKLIEKGMFDNPKEHGEWEEVRITYKSADGSNQATNHIDIAIYYYNTVQSIPYNVSNLMRAHQAQVLGVDQPAIPTTFGPYDPDLPENVSYAKPRPPCIIIVGN